MRPNVIARYQLTLLQPPGFEWDDAKHLYVNVCSFTQHLLGDGVDFPVLTKDAAERVSQVRFQHFRIVAGENAQLTGTIVPHYYRENSAKTYP